MKVITIGLIAFLISLVSLVVSAFGYAVRDDVYSAWTDHGVHLMICDNGTPDNYDDDYICDWETNRIFEIEVIE